MSQLLESTPRADGFRMPAEWEHHTGCWMIFPQRPDTWRNGGKPAQKVFVDVATAISQFESVTIGVNHDQYQNARAMLPSHIRVVELSNNDAWMRDTGATFVINDNGQIRGVDWTFNAWGGLDKMMYFPWDKDDLVASKMCEMERIDRYRTAFINEGGSIHTDGQGTLLTTESCQLNPNRNPNLSLTEVETHLQDYLGIEKIIWLGQGVFEDETDGHIDNLCCFVRPGVVALTWTDDKSDPQYDRSAEAYDRLMSMTDAQGQELEVHKIHQPNPMTMTQEEADGLDVVDTAFLRPVGERLAGSYINFYIANGGIVMPQFNDEYDVPAKQKLAELFSNHDIIGISAREILLGGGNIHCITQQQPAP